MADTFWNFPDALLVGNDCTDVPSLDSMTGGPCNSPAGNSPSKMEQECPTLPLQSCLQKENVASPAWS